MATKEQILERLKTVMDPELHVNIVDLGLIYEVKVGTKVINVKMTLTTPGCPLAPEIDKLVRKAIKPLGNYTLKLNLVWEPVWTKERMSEEARLKLGVR